MTNDSAILVNVVAILAVAGSITELIERFADEKKLNSEQTIMIFSFVSWLFAQCAVWTPTPPPVPEPPPATTNAPIVHSTTLMPLEVLGPGGTTESITLVTTNGHLADSLTLTTFNLQYEGMASVAINGTNWVNLFENQVGYTRPMDAAMWGLGGVHSVLHIVMPVTNWTTYNGTNTFNFKFNDLNGLTIGFRILALNLQHDGTNLMSSGQFIQDDPATWVGPSTNSVDIAAGEDAWFNLRISEQGTNLVYVYPPGTTNNITCAMCHDRHGRDLSYFNFSDRSIIERSVFHGVPRPTATNIASYIRSLRADYPVPYATNGRPWNPPYQPGPGMSDVPVYYWAAGAGLDWVLTNDLASFEYMFPGGATTNSIGSYTNTMDAREIPLAVQMPSWNAWLPRIHPLFSAPSYYVTNRYYGIYAEMTNRLNSLSGVAAGSYFNGRKHVWDSQNDRGGLSEPPASSPDYFQYWTNLVSNRHWRHVKTWEIMTEHQIEEYGTNIFGPLSDNRRWFHGETFELAPHKTHIPSYEAWTAQTMQWYQLQLVLNSGNRKNGSIVPIDWGYQASLNKSSWVNPTNEITYSVMLLNVIKGIEVTVNDLPMSNVNGWSPFKGEPNYVAAIASKAFYYNLIPVDYRRTSANAIITPWLAKCNEYTRADYIAAGKLVGNTGLGNRVYLMTENFISIGADTNMTAGLYRFGTNIWPEIDWSAVAP